MVTEQTLPSGLTEFKRYISNPRQEHLLGCAGCIVAFWNDGGAPNVPNDPPSIPVGCESSGPDIGNPVGCEMSGCVVTGKPVGCAERNEGGAWPWKGDALNGRVGTKLLNPVVVGMRGCNR